MKNKDILIISLIVSLVMCTGCFEEEDNGDGKNLSGITPVISMNWVQDDENPRDYIGNVVQISGDQPKIWDVNVVYTQGSDTDSKYLDEMQSTGLEVGTMTMTFSDNGYNTRLGTEDTFTATGVEEGDILRLVFRVNSEEMYSHTF